MRSIALALLASSLAALSCAALIGLEQGVPREDAGVDVEAGGVAYSDLTDPSAWTTFDLQPSIGRSQAGFIGGTFDGRYVYFSPGGAMGMNYDVVFRYDTTSSFGLSGSWGSYALGQLNMNARGFFGAVLHDKTVVFVPYASPVAAFYDTAKPLDAGFVLRAPPTTGLVGGVSDGRSIFMAPHYTNMNYHGVVVRYQDAGPEAGGFAQFNMASQIDMSAVGYFGGVYDGRYVYFAPFISPLVVRYDTMAVYADAGSWRSFDSTQVSPAAKQYSAAAFDGRFMYFIPGVGGLVVRYDTTASFGALSSWSAFDVATKAATARGYQGAVFDGRYLYLVPNATTIAVRFDAKIPPSLPPFYNGGSFL